MHLSAFETTNENPFFGACIDVLHAALRQSVPHGTVSAPFAAS